MKMSLLLLMMMVMVGVSLLMGSHALKCYKCGAITGDANPKGKPCLDPTLPMDTCEAKEYCATIGFKCGAGTIHSLILSSR